MDNYMSMKASGENNWEKLPTNIILGKNDREKQFTQIILR